MKHQEVNVDYWAMGKAMLIYGALTALIWLMLRLFNTVFNLPRRLNAQQDRLQNSLKEIQKRFPDLNITEEDLKNAEKELEEFTRNDKEKCTNNSGEIQNIEKEEEKKTI